MHSRAGFILGLAIACVSLVVLGDVLAAAVPLRLIGNAPENAIALQPHVLDHFFVWDSRWYEKIADLGYSWHKNDHRQQAIAFLPLWPLILASLHLAAPSHVATIALCGIFGLLSVWRMHVLAGKMLPEADARVATMLYALYPAAIFLLHDYPVGLLNCLTICALDALLAKRKLLAAIFSGVAMAAGPLALALPLTLSVVIGIELAGQFRMRTLSPWLWRNALVMAIACSGLGLFCVWQYWRFADPLAFVHAQEGWAGASPPFLVHVIKTVVQLAVIPAFVEAALALHTARLCWQTHDFPEMQRQVQGAMNVAGFGIGMVAMVGWRSPAARVLLVHGLIVFGLYTWFVGSQINGWATLRLIYIAPAPFLGAAVLLKGRPRVATAVISVSGLLMCANEFMMSAGYPVI